MATGYDNVLQDLNNSSLLVRIITSSSTFKGLLTDDFSFSSSSSWSGSSTDSGAAQSALKIVSEAKLQTAFSSTVSWEGTEHPNFKVNMIVPALSDKDNVIAKVRDLYPLIYPQSMNAVTVDPPLGFSTNLARSQITGGSIAVRIGGWFHAPGMVATDLEVTYSKALTKRNLPLFASVSLGVKSALMPTASTVQAYFIG